MSSAESSNNSIFSTLLASIGLYWQPKEASQALSPVMDEDIDLCLPESTTIVRSKDGAYQLGRVLGTGISKYLVSQVFLLISYHEIRKVAHSFKFLGADSTVREATLLSSVPTNTSQRVALKIIDKPKRRPDQLDRTRFEAAVGQLFRHPNVIEVLEVIESSRFLILVLPYAANGDLLDFLNRRRRFAETEAARAILQIAHALEYAHSNHVIHHDVKLVSKRSLPDVDQHSLLSLPGKHSSHF